MLQETFKMSKCKLTLVVLISICLGIASSCNSPVKDRIEIKFQDYVSNNFDNPKDLVEVVSIVKTDSFDILQYINTVVNEVSLDSLQKIMLKHSEKLIKLGPKLPSNIRGEMGKKIFPIILEANSSIYSDMSTYNLKKKELSILSENIDSARAMSRNYLIKARVKHNGEVVMKKFHAMDCCIIDSVVISDAPIQTADLPSQTSEALSIFNDLWVIINKQMDINDRLNKLVNECELYTD